MANRDIEVQGGDYEHTLGFGTPTGQVPAIRYRKAALGDLSRVVLSGERFGVAEYSLANHIMLRDRGDHRLSAIPVFPSRAFRNASVFVRKDSSLSDLRALAGKRVGVSDFAMTTAVWTRGHLHDDCGLDWKDIDWVTGPKPRFPSPPGVRVTETTGNLETLLLDGQIDALMAGKPKDSQLPLAERQLRCVDADTEGIERRYLATTGLFPIMHAVVLHPEVACESDQPKRIFDLYVQTKAEALKRKLSTSWLPFADRAWDTYCPSGGADPYAHGLSELNRRNIATLARYLLEQRLIERLPDIDALFVPGSADWIDAGGL